MKRGSDQLQPLVEPSIQALQKVFQIAQQGGALEVDDIQVARLASTQLSTWSKLKQSESAQDAVYFAMARELATDKEQLAKYIAITMPDTPIVKQLQEPKKK